MSKLNWTCWYEQGGLLTLADKGVHNARSARLVLTLLLGISLFDQIKLLSRAIAPCLIIGEHVLAAIGRGAHQIHGLLAKRSQLSAT